MSTRDIDTEPNASNDYPYPSIPRVLPLISYIKCKKCGDVVSDCDLILHGMFPMIPISLSSTHMPVQIHEDGICIKVNNTELISKRLMRVGLEITHIGPPDDCRCIEDNVHPRLRLIAVFPLCEHNEDVDNDTNTITTFLDKSCELDHSNNTTKRNLRINMAFDRKNNSWSYSHDSEIKIPCDNIIKSARKT